MTARELDHYLRFLPTDELEALMEKAQETHRSLERALQSKENDE